MCEIVTNNYSLIDGVDISAIQKTMEKITQFQSVVQKSLKSDMDYGKIPGVNKPTLLKPGGEKICMLFGLNPEYEFLATTEDYQSEFFSYNIKCTLFKNGYPCAQGVGSCNSKEKKYRYINVDEVPENYTGYSEKFTNNYGKVKFKIENNDTCSLVNTILKMAKKRAFIDAVLQVASLSEIFTQDMEDMQEFNRQEEQAATANMTAEEAGRIKLNFGKHKGKTLSEIYKEDKGYLEWMLTSDKTSVPNKTAISIMFNAVKDVVEKKKQTKQTIEAKEQPLSEPPPEDINYEPELGSDKDDEELPV